MKRIGEHAGLLVILAAFLALGMVYLRSTPLLETPDEPSHFSLVKYIADEARLPRAQPAPPDAGPVPIIRDGPPVYYAPPLYYVLGALLIADLNTDGFAQGVVPNPNWARGWAPTPGRSPQNKHIYVLTADQRPPRAGWAVAMLRLRIFSLLLGGTTVCGVYALASTLWSPRAVPWEGYAGQGWPLAAAALVAFNPAYLFVTIGVTNDALLIALSTWAFVLMVRLVRSPSPARPAVVLSLGIVLGLAALTKQSALAFLPVAALAVTWSASSQHRPWRRAIQWLALCFVPVALLAAWWYVHNSLTYGDVLGFQPHQAPSGEWQPTFSLLLKQLGEALRGYWGAFGWGLILVEPIIYVGIALFVLGGLVGLVVSGLSGGWRRRPHAERRVVVILVLGLLLNFLGLLAWQLRTSAPYGRLLFPTLGPLAVLLVLGWQASLRHRHSWLFAGGVALVFGLYAAVVPWRYLRPAYIDPVVAASTVEKATPVDVQFNVGDVGAASDTATLHLLGYRVSPPNAKPGDRVTLTLYWRAQERVGIPLTVFVQVAPGDPEKRVASQDDYLGGSHYPNQLWQAGETIRQVHELQLPDHAPAPALYWFRVGLYHESSGARLPVTADGTPVPANAVRLGSLRVLSRDRPQPRYQTDYRFGAAIRLTGYDIDVVAADSSGLVQTNAIMVTLYWQADATPEEDFTVFVHLLDADGRRVAQQDSPPRQGDYPTGVWQRGDQVPDAHTLLTPSDQETGPYRLVVGLYRPRDGLRVPVVDASGGRVPDDAAVLTEVILPDEGE